MRAVVQRVSSASVTVAGAIVGEVGAGLLVYAAAAPDDTATDVRYIADKVTHLRIFPDEAGKQNLSVSDTGGGVLVVSAFTAHADARKGRRPSFDSSAGRDVAEPLVEQLYQALRDNGLTVATGKFAADMDVASVNDGPICVLLDSRKLF